MKGSIAIKPLRVQAFRFLDLPAELRKTIYDILLKESEPIAITTFKIPGLDRRPARRGFMSRTLHTGLEWDTSSGKYIGQEPSNLATARVNHQLQDEVLPIAYGNNIFNFNSIGDMKVFLETVGDTARYLNHISLPMRNTYTGSLRTKAFEALKPAKRLKTLAIHHINICNTDGRHSCCVRLEDFFNDVFPYLRDVYDTLRANNRFEEMPEVANIVKVTTDNCYECERSNAARCDRVRNGCKTKCGQDSEEHCKEVEARFRTMLKKGLGLIKEEEDGRMIDDEGDL